MKRFVLKYFSVFIIGLMLFNSMGYYFVNQAIRLIHRKQVFAMLQSVPDNLLTTFIIKKTERKFSGIQNINREFSYNGRKYDIKKKVDNGTYFIIYCLSDTREDFLIEQSTKIGGQLQHRVPFSRVVILILENIIKTALLSETSDLLNTFAIIRHEFTNSVFILGPALPVPSLPPQLLNS